MEASRAAAFKKKKDFFKKNLVRTFFVFCFAKMKKKVPRRHYYTHPGAIPETEFPLVWPWEDGIICLMGTIYSKNIAFITRKMRVCRY